MHPGIATAHAGERFSAHNSGGAYTWIDSPSVQPLARVGRSAQEVRGAPDRPCSQWAAATPTHPHRANVALFPPSSQSRELLSLSIRLPLCAGTPGGLPRLRLCPRRHRAGRGGRTQRRRLLCRVGLGRGLPLSAGRSYFCDVCARRARMGRACARHGMLRARRQRVHGRGCRAHAGEVRV